MNVNIFLKQFKCSHKEIIEMLEEGDVTKIGPERLRGLKKILPEKDEVYDIIKLYNCCNYCESLNITDSPTIQENL